MIKMMRTLPFLTLLFLLAVHGSSASFLSEENDEVTNDSPGRRVAFSKEKYRGEVIESPFAVPLFKEELFASPYDAPIYLGQMKKSHSSVENEKTSELLQDSTIIPPLSNAKAPVDDYKLPKGSISEKILGAAVNTEEDSQKLAETSESHQAKTIFDMSWSLKMSDSFKNENMVVARNLVGRPLTSFEGRKRASILAASSTSSQPISTLVIKPAVPFRNPISPQIRTPTIPRKPYAPVDFKPAVPFEKTAVPQIMTATATIPQKPNAPVDFKPAVPLRKPVAPKIVTPTIPQKPNVPIYSKPAVPIKKPIAPKILTPTIPRKPKAPAPVLPVVAPVVVLKTQQPSPGLQDGVAAKVVYNGKGWIGIGLSQTGEMIGTEGTVIGIPNGGVSTDVMIYNMIAYSLSGAVPWTADQQVLQNQTIDQTTKNKTIMTWRMPFPDNSLGIFPVIWAYGTNNTLAYHGPNRSSKIFPIILAYCADNTTAASPNCKPDDPNYDQVTILKEGVLTIYTKQIKIRIPSPAPAPIAVLAPVSAQCPGSNPLTCGCLNVNQTDYRGYRNTTASGRTCQAWASQSPHQHTRTPSNYPYAGLVSNYCRNPDGESKAWCYTTDVNMRWELCAVPVCQIK